MLFFVVAVDIVVVIYIAVVVIGTAAVADIVVFAVLVDIVVIVDIVVVVDIVVAVVVVVDIVVVIVVVIDIDIVLLRTGHCAEDEIVDSCIGVNVSVCVHQQIIIIALDFAFRVRSAKIVDFDLRLHSCLFTLVFWVYKTPPFFYATSIR